MAGCPAIRITAITMAEADGHAQLKLLTWLSPAFPIGGFSYSHGLERAVHDGLVATAGDLGGWLETLVEQGSGWNDAVLLGESWRRALEGDDLADIAALAEALAGSRERHLETMAQGTAFLEAASAWQGSPPPGLPADCAYCVAVGAVAGSHGLPLRETLTAFLHAFLSNLLQAGIRLGVLGQVEATRLLAGFEPLVLGIAARAAHSTLADLGGAAFIAETMAMRHEIQQSRLFRS
jgi:urease accessory protein